jgi:hypothetical protein
MMTLCAIVVVWAIVAAVLAYYGRPWERKRGSIDWVTIVLWPVVLPLAVMHQ